MRSFLNTFQGKLLVVILPASLGLFLFVLVGNYYSAKKQILSATEKDLLLFTQRAAGDINGIIEQRINDLFLVAQNPLFLDYYNNAAYGLTEEANIHRQQLGQFLGEFAKRVPLYPRIYFLDARGQEILRIADGHFITMQNSHLGQPYFREALKKEPAAFYCSDEPSFSESGHKLFYLSKTLRFATGERIGVLVFGYDMNHLDRFIDSLKPSPQGGVMLLRKNKETLSGSFHAPKGGVKDRVWLAHLPWMLEIYIPTTDFMNPVLRVRNLSLAGGAAASLATILIIISAVRMLTKPINALVRGTRELAKGNLDYQIVQVEGPQEISVLSRAFNEMAAQIKEREEKQKKLQGQLIQSEKLSVVGQLISNIAHELNHPLAGITGYAELLLQETCPDVIRRDLKRIHNHARRSRNIVENLLLFVRQSAPEKHAVDLNKVVRSVLSLLEYRLAKADDIKVVFTAGKIPKVLGDFQQLEQVVLNIIANACDAIRTVSHERRIAISTRNGASKVQVGIADNGPGMTAEILNKIFDPFFTTKQEGLGTGLGLTIAVQIIKDHQGLLRCESEPGGGTRFLIEIPAAEHAMTDSKKNGKQRRRLHKGKRLLIIDDEKDIARMIKRLALKGGYDAEAVYGAKTAISKLNRAHYDLLLVDLEMPGFDGKDLYHLFIKTKPSMVEHMLFITGDVLSPGSLEFFEKSGMPHLKKPFEAKELFAAIELVFDRKQNNETHA